MRSRLCMDALLRTLLAPLSLLLTTQLGACSNAAAQGGEEPMQCAPCTNSFAGVRHTLELEEVRSQAPTARAESRWAEEMGETPESLAALSSHEMRGWRYPIELGADETYQPHPGAEARSPSIYMVVADVHDPWVVARGSGIRVSRASELEWSGEASVATIDREPLILFPRGDHIPAPADEWFCEPGHGFQCSSTRLVALEAIGPNPAIRTRMEPIVGFGSFETVHLVHELVSFSVLALPAAYLVLRRESGRGSHPSTLGVRR